MNGHRTTAIGAGRSRLQMFLAVTCRKEEERWKVFFGSALMQMSSHGKGNKLKTACSRKDRCVVLPNKADEPDCFRRAMPHASGFKSGLQQVIRNVRFLNEQPSSL